MKDLEDVKSLSELLYGKQTILTRTWEFSWKYKKVILVTLIVIVLLLRFIYK